MKAGSRKRVSVREKELELLLAAKVEGGARPSNQAASRTWKRQEHILPGPLREECGPADSLFLFSEVLIFRAVR